MHKVCSNAVNVRELGSIPRVGANFFRGQDVMIGIGAMIHSLSGGSQNSPSVYVGKTIVAARLNKKNEDRLEIDFADGTKIDVWDNGQSCCESRYITTDDDLSTLVGGVLKHIEVKSCDSTNGWHDEVHETAFVEVATDKGFVTIATHNEHNGYYGGFGLTITERE